MAMTTVIMVSTIAVSSSETPGSTREIGSRVAGLVAEHPEVECDEHAEPDESDGEEPCDDSRRRGSQQLAQLLERLIGLSQGRAVNESGQRRMR